MSSSSARYNFAHDLKKLREERGVSLEDVYDQTKIPHELLLEFEDTGLAEHEMFNRVYLRSMVRSYARMIQLAEEEVLTHLDQAIAGTYAGGLAVKYLDETEKAQSTTREEDSSIQAESGILDSVDPKHEEEPLSEAIGQDAEIADSNGIEPTGIEEKKEKSEVDKSEVVPTIEDAQIQLNRELGRPKSVSGLRKNPSLVQWSVIVGGIVILATAIISVLAVLNRNGEAGPSPTPFAEDSATTEPEPLTLEPEPLTLEPEPLTLEPEPEPITRAIPQVGDSIDVVLVSGELAVEGFRIRRDNDLRRPYWLDPFQAKRFPAADRIIIEEHLDKFQLIVEGYLYPTSRTDTQGRIFITRETAQAFLDSVSAAPYELAHTPQTIPLGEIITQ